MLIFPPRLEISDTEGFTKEKDLFGRAALGAGLTNFVTKVTDPTVVAIDGQWGSGKTTFLKMWAGELRKSGTAVVYFDAFEQDYSEDAFTSIASEIIAVAQEKKKAATDLGEEFVNKAIGAGKVILRSALRLGVKLGTAGALEAADLVTVAGDIAKEVSSLEDKYLGELLTKQATQKDAIQSFRDALSSLPDLLTSDTPDGADDDLVKRPLIVIVDELDRCRPLFALQILERMKHFFAVPRVHFVLGTNLSQLQNSVSVAYGPGIDAHKYLQKFIHLTMHLVDSAQRQHERISTKYIEHLVGVMQLPRTDTVDLAKQYFRHAVESQNLSLRAVERLMSTFAVALASERKNIYAAPAIIVGLCLLKVTAPDLYIKAKAGTAAWVEMQTPLGFATDADGQDKSALDYMADYWRFCIGNDDPILDQRFGQGLWNFNLGRKQLVPFVANNIVDRLVPA